MGGLFPIREDERKFPQSKAPGDRPHPQTSGEGLGKHDGIGTPWRARASGRDWACLLFNKVNASLPTEPIESPGEGFAGGFVTMSRLRIRRLRKTVRSYAEKIEALNQASTGKRSNRYRMTMLTLTYRDDARWEPRDVTDFLQRVRQWCRRRGFKMRYVWVAEMQEERAATFGVQKPHFHLLIWVPRQFALPKPDKQGWWTKGSTKIESARSVGYLVKYTSKAHLPESCEFPSGMRIYGNGGLDGDDLNFHRHEMKPAWVREFVPVGVPWKRMSGGAKRLDNFEWKLNPYVVLLDWRDGCWGLHITKRRMEDGGALYVDKPNGVTHLMVPPPYDAEAFMHEHLREFYERQALDRAALWAEAVVCADDVDWLTAQRENGF